MKDDLPSGYIKYEGPSVKDGTIEVKQLSEVILGFNAAFQKISLHDKKFKDLKTELRVKIKKGSVELWFAISAIAYVADKVGFTELSRNFFAEVGSQLGLKLFSRNKPLKEKSLSKNAQRITIILVNEDGEEKEVSITTYEIYKLALLEKDLSSLVIPLERHKIEKVEYGYKDRTKIREIVAIKEEDKVLFLPKTESVHEQLYNDEKGFDETIAEEISALEGKLIEYDALKHDFPFGFQVKKTDGSYDKRAVPCMIADQSKRDDCIESMKSYVGDVCISGKGIKNKRGNYKKIKIRSLDKNHQIRLFKDTN